MANVDSESYVAFDSGGATRIAGFLEWHVSHRGLEGPIDVLDVGCGPGRMFPAFRALGWKVVSMEPDSDFHEAAIVAAAAAGFSTPRRAGFLEIDVQDTFDLVTAINDPFSHMLTGRNRAEALGRVFQALKPRGVVVLDVPNFLWILKNYRAPEPMRTSTSNADVELRREHAIDFHSATFTTIEHYDLVRDGEHHRSSKTHPYAMTTLPELEWHLESAGFTDIESFGSWDARAPERVGGARLIVSGVRPG